MLSSVVAIETSVRLWLANVAIKITLNLFIQHCMVIDVI